MTDIYDLENLKSIDELHQMPLEEAKAYFLKMRELHGAEKIRLKWNLPLSSMYKSFYKEYGIEAEYKQKDAAKENNKNPETQKPEKKTRKNRNKDNGKSEIDPVPQLTILPTYIIQVRGEFEGVDARGRLIKIAEALTEKKYKVTLTVEEL